MNDVKNKTIDAQITFCEHLLDTDKPAHTKNIKLVATVFELTIEEATKIYNAVRYYEI